MSSETKDVVTYMHVKDNISKYELDININSIPLKNKIVEVDTILKFDDKKETKTKKDTEKTTKSKTVTKKKQAAEDIENAGTTNLGALLKAKLDDGKDD